jgi:mono/diheme cytochrome c family protein
MGMAPNYVAIRQFLRSLAMTKTIRSMAVLAATVCLAGSMGFAQAGEAVYKANCQSCHGSTGTPNPGIAKAMGVKPTTDPDYKKVSEADMIAAVKNGKGKMKAMSPKLTDDQIKESVVYFRSLK